MMIDPKLGGIGSVTDAASSNPSQDVRKTGAEGSAAFRALLERFEAGAKALDEASRSVDDPRTLGEAVRGARQSVQEALLVGSDLLEAYRAAQSRAAAAPNAAQPDDSQRGPGGGQ